MALGDQDMAVFFADGVQVAAPDGTTAMANLDWPEEVDYLHAQSTAGVVVGKPVITYATGSLILKSGQQVTVDGTVYVVRYTWKIDDGKLSKAELNKAVA
jgi:hypothetical protein